jgi:hypothetical protein
MVHHFIHTEVKRLDKWKCVHVALVQAVNGVAVAVQSDAKLPYPDHVQLAQILSCKITTDRSWSVFVAENKNA